MKALIHPTYFPSIAHWVVISHHQEKLVMEAQDNYQKQTYRNRAHIYSPNGKQLLTVPIVHTKTTGHQKYRQVTIEDRKSTRLNSSHVKISYAVFCLKKKITPQTRKTSRSV